MKSPTPAQLEYITRWLEETYEGRKLVYQAFEKYIPREPVLVVINCDYRPMVQVYANRNVSCHIATQIASQDSVSQIMAEDYMEMTLPHRYKELYYRGRIAAGDLVERIEVEDEIRRRCSPIQAYRAVGRIAAGEERGDEDQLIQRAVWAGTI